MSLFKKNKHERNYFVEYDTDYVYYTSSKKADNTSYKTELFDWIDIVVVALVTVIVAFTFLFRVATIDGVSMQNTFQDGEKVIISNLDYTPSSGDVVVLSRNYLNNPDNDEQSARPIIKRIIATEGQTVSIDFARGIVYVDGQALSEPYTKTPTNNKLDLDFPFDGDVVTVPENCVFVLGDNRNNSLDSRSSTIGNLGNGMIDTRYIIGKVRFRIFPISKFGGIK